MDSAEALLRGSMPLFSYPPAMRCPAVVQLACCAMSGTETGYAATRGHAADKGETRGTPIVLRVRYEMSSTEIGYASTRRGVLSTTSADMCPRQAHLYSLYSVADGGDSADALV
eukprot:3435591-Rhodomonas_salina.1